MTKRMMVSGYVGMALALVFMSANAYATAAKQICTISLPLSYMGSDRDAAEPVFARVVYDFQLNVSYARGIEPEMIQLPAIDPSGTARVVLERTLNSVAYERILKGLNLTYVIRTSNGVRVLAEERIEPGQISLACAMVAN